LSVGESEVSSLLLTSVMSNVNVKFESVHTRQRDVSRNATPRKQSNPIPIVSVPLPALATGDKGDPVDDHGFFSVLLSLRSRKFSG
jgi:hypothetical protein